MSRTPPPGPVDLSWDHNSHYHGHLLRHLPPHRTRALDVGCGNGRFARVLASRGVRVDAIDPSPRMIEVARAGTPSRLPVDYRAVSLEEADPAPEGYGFVSAVSSIHHMPFGPALERMAAALVPGGTLAVLGLYREESAVDTATGLAALGPQWAIGLGLRLGRALTRTPDVRALCAADETPVRDPEMSLREITAEAAERLPGSRVRRLLFWRYSLVYTRPA
ncbi:MULTISPECIES: bifunctional 2-polyprenyl-6-hydroxyphenol methylase/3-demethylubiquinol 3-O-methyltransferase UbiG [unclassified Nocardiopsis]|uniref:class I SAM-dependent methyltransferase n=1 Tax=unclassified Nocardiopsis TaxID=2649073 RepID=UPI001359F7E1|nr:MULTISPECIES: class I SAM-dependent methyltransferase [unclassified Nocardiopsis]